MATEQEHDFESADPTGQGRGTLTDDDEDDGFGMGEEEEKPFTEMNQFEQFDTSTELLAAMADAGEEQRKHAEDRAKAGYPLPQSGLPDPDVFMMEHLLFYVGGCEARVERAPNQNSIQVKKVKTAIDDHLDLIHRWIENNKYLHEIKTRGSGKYIKNDVIRATTIKKINLKKQNDLGDLEERLAKVWDGMGRLEPSLQSAAFADRVALRGSGAELLSSLKKTDAKTKKDQRFKKDFPSVYLAQNLLDQFDTLTRQMENIDEDNPRYNIFKDFSDEFIMFLELKAAVEKFDQSSHSVDEIKKSLGTDNQLTEWLTGMLKFRKAWDDYEQRPRPRGGTQASTDDEDDEEAQQWKVDEKIGRYVKKSKDERDRPPKRPKMERLKHLPPTPQIKKKHAKISPAVAKMQIAEYRKDMNKRILPDIQQGWEEGGEHVKSWLDQIKGIVDAFKGPLEQLGLTQSTVDGWFEKNLYQKWYNRYGQRSDVIRPSALFSTVFVAKRRISILKDFVWFRGAFDAIRGTKDKYITFLSEAIQNDANYDAWVAKQHPSGQQDETDEEEDEDEDDDGNREDEKMPEVPETKSRKPVFNAAKVVAQTYDAGKAYFDREIFGLFEDIKKRRIGDTEIEKLIEHFKQVGDPSPNNLDLLSKFTGEDEQTIRAKYLEYSIPEAIDMVYKKYAAEIDARFRQLKPHIVEQYEAKPLTEHEIHKLEPLANVDIRDVPPHISKFINNLALTIIQTSLWVRAQNQPPTRPQLSQVGHAPSPPTELEQLKTTIAKLKAADTAINKSMLKNKAEHLRLINDDESALDDINASLRELDEQKTARQIIQKDLADNEDNLKNFDKIAKRREEDTQRSIVTLRDRLKRTEHQYAKLGQAIASYKPKPPPRTSAQSDELGKEWDKAISRVERYTKLIDRNSAYIAQPQTRPKNKTAAKVKAELTVYEKSLDKWQANMDDIQENISKVNAIRKENEKQEDDFSQQRHQLSLLEKDIHSISSELEYKLGKPIKKPTPPRSVDVSARRDTMAATPAARPRVTSAMHQVPDHPNRIPGQIEVGVPDTARSQATTIYYASPMSARRQREFMQFQPDFDKFGTFPEAPPELQPRQLAAPDRAQEEEEYKEEQRRNHVARRGDAILDEDFRYDYDRRRWVPKLQQFKTYLHYKYRGDDAPYTVPATYTEEVSWVQRRSKHAEYLDDGGPERFLREQRRTNPLAKPSAKATMIGDHITVKIYPHSIHFIFTRTPHTKAISIMCKRIAEHVKSNEASRLLTSQVEKGRKTIKTLISQRDLPNISDDHLQNIVARSHRKHFILRFEMYGGAIHDKYDKDFHLL